MGTIFLDYSISDREKEGSHSQTEKIRKGGRANYIVSILVHYSASISGNMMHRAIKIGNKIK